MSESTLFAVPFDTDAETPYAPSSQLKKPSLATARGPLYFSAPPSLEEQTRANLTRMLSELVEEGEEITVTDPRLPFQMSLRILYDASS